VLTWEGTIKLKGIQNHPQVLKRSSTKSNTSSTYKKSVGAHKPTGERKSVEERSNSANG